MNCVIGRFSTFLEHVKATAGSERVTRYNALFHWAVPPGREIEAGREVAQLRRQRSAVRLQSGPLLLYLIETYLLAGGVRNRTGDG